MYISTDSEHPEHSTAAGINITQQNISTIGTEGQQMNNC